MPVGDLKLLTDEATARGKEPSVLAREIIREALSGPGKATVGRLAARRAVVQKAEKPVLQEPSVVQPVVQIKTKSSAPVTFSDRLRQMRDNGNE